MNKLYVNTPVGKIAASVLQDEEYPGIALLLENVDGQPGVIMEYNPGKKCVQVRVYGKDDPDGDPIQVLDMSEPLKEEVDDNNCESGIYDCNTCNIRNDCSRCDKEEYEILWSKFGDV
ncbi:MAG: hypothetical protein KH031_09635, partial [Clostridiales bacterium]|nr:hypothetical protein [Clostridiales bacterium]